jgi:alanine racemase
MRALASISQSALAHNLSIVRQFCPNSDVVCMIKSNAYGHHLDLIKPLFQGEILAVSELSEAEQLRPLTNAPILLLSGVFNQDELRQALALNCQLVLHDISQLTVINQSNQPLKIWLKVDTGMRRLGLSPQDFQTCLTQLNRNPNVKIEAVMSHLACADEPNHPQNKKQLTLFNQLDYQQIPKSLANSAAILQLPATHFDYVRPGIMLYGASPFAHINALLLPVMELSAPIICLKTIKAGQSVGYGANWTAKKDTNIAIIGIGYGDGYPRHAKNTTPVLIQNRLCGLIGRVSMDLICVEIGDLNLNIGDKAILWGDAQLRVETVAAYSDTISYELLTGVSARVKFSKRA